MYELESTGSVWRECIPFIDKGDGLTSERERVHMLLSLVVHAGGYRRMVGAQNTIGCRLYVGGYVVLFWVWQMSAPTYTIDAQRHVRSLTMFTWYGKSRRPQHCRCPEACGGPYHMGVNGAHNTVRGNVGAYNIVCVRAVAEYCSVKGMVPSTVGLTFEPCLAFLRTSLGP